MRDKGSDGPPGAADIGHYRANLQGEIDGAAIYRTMAAAETNPALQELYRRLAETEARHGGIWRERLEAAGIATVQLGPSWRTRILMWIARRFGPEAVVASIAEKESTDQLTYDAQPEATAKLSLLRFEGAWWLPDPGSAGRRSPARHRRAYSRANC